MTAKNKIPKKIHQVWIGNAAKAPRKFMRTWEMKGWEYNLWDEKAIAGLKLKNQKLFDMYYSQANWHGASDVVRLEVLERFGGIYIDADTERLAEIDDAPFMEAGFFAVEANRSRGVPQGQNRIANGIIGSVPHHVILKKYIAAMGKAKVVLPPWSTIGGTLFTQVIYDNRTDDTLILEPHTFYPFDSSGRPSRTQGKTYARHVWGTTHKLYGKI